MRFAMFECLVGIQSGVDATEYYPGAPLPRHATYRVAAQCVTGVNSDSDYVALLHARRIPTLQSFVAEKRISKTCGGRRRQYVKPTRSDDRGSERSVAGID